MFSSWRKRGKKASKHNNDSQETLRAATVNSPLGDNSRSFIEGMIPHDGPHSPLFSRSQHAALRRAQFASAPPANREIESSSAGRAHTPSRSERNNQSQSNKNYSQRLRQAETQTLPQMAAEDSRRSNIASRPQLQRAQTAAAPPAPRARTQVPTQLLSYTSVLRDSSPRLADGGHPGTRPACVIVNLLPLNRRRDEYWGASPPRAGFLTVLSDGQSSRLVRDGEMEDGQRQQQESEERALAREHEKWRRRLEYEERRAETEKENWRREKERERREIESWWLQKEEDERKTWRDTEKWRREEQLLEGQQQREERSRWWEQSQSTYRCSCLH